MSIQSEITRLSGNVSAALSAIEAKGVTIPSGANSDDLADLIAQIDGGGGDEPSGPTYETIIPLQTINCTIGLSNGAYGGYITNYTEYTSEGQKYRVIFDGTEYTPLTATYYGSGTTYLYVGDANVEASSTVTPTYPFEIMLYDGQTFYLGVKGSGSHTLQVDKITSEGGGGGSSATLITKEITANGTYSASDDSADGYSQVTVNVPSQAGAAMNTQIAQGVDRVATTSYTAVSGQSITVEVTGTYDVYWTGFRSSTGGTNGSQLYIGSTAYGTAQTTFSNHGQSVKLTGVQLTAGQVVTVRARARGTNYYMYVGNLTIVQTA